LFRGANRLLLGALLGLSFGGSVAWSQESQIQQQSWPPQPATQQDRQPTADHNEAESGPSASGQTIGDEHAGHGYESSSGKDWSKIFIDHLPDWFVALFTFVLSVFTALLWLSTRKLWKAGEQQISVAKSAAEAAKLSADILPKLERAFVTSNEVRIEERRKDGVITSWVLRPVIENSGNTPTKDLRYSTSGVWGPVSDDYPGVVLPTREDNPERGYQAGLISTTLPRLVLGARAKVTMGWIELTIDDLKHMKTNPTRAFICGSIHYLDVFSKDTEHITKFCYVIRVEELPSGDLQPAYSHGSYWNSADEECEAEDREYRAAVAEAFRKGGMAVPIGFFWPLPD